MQVAQAVQRAKSCPQTSDGMVSELQQCALDDAWDILMRATKAHVLACHNVLPHESRPTQPVRPTQLGICRFELDP